MIDYGPGPDPDELEVMVFGPGFGEAVLVHLGEGQWIAIDSCHDPQRRPATLAYLNSIGVAANAVQVIVASHWHDDHVRGISELASSFPEAEFHMSTVFNNREALAFLGATSSRATGGRTRGCDELYRVVTERPAEKVWFSHQRSILLQRTILGHPVTVTAFSPVPAAFGRMIDFFARSIPQSGTQPHNAAPSKPNLEAVAIHVEAGDCCLLLGSDLENHAQLGWAGVLADDFCRQRSRASVYKVAHHGSVSGDEEGIWEELLVRDVNAIATPFSLGRQRLPTELDRARIRAKTPNSFLSSRASGRPRIEPSQLKRLQEIATNIAPVNTGFGAIRLRRRHAEHEWRRAFFGDSGRM